MKQKLFKTAFIAFIAIMYIVIAFMAGVGVFLLVVAMAVLPKHPEAIPSLILAAVLILTVFVGVKKTTKELLGGLPPPGVKQSE